MTNRNVNVDMGITEWCEDPCNSCSEADDGFFCRQGCTQTWSEDETVYMVKHAETCSLLHNLEGIVVAWDETEDVYLLPVPWERTISNCEGKKI